MHTDKVILKQQELKNFPSELQDVFHFLSISTDYSLIGSSSYRNINYNNDFDLNEIYTTKDTKDILTKIYKMFKEKYIMALQDPDYYLVDFKCGEDERKQPIRWTYDDIMKGKKGKYKFQDCLLMKSTMKLDLIYIFNGMASEVTENYYLKIGSKANFDEPYFDKEELVKNLLTAYNEYVQDKCYFKALKRLFSIQAIEKKPSKKLVDLFNSNLGLLYKCINNLGCVSILLEQTFKEAPIEQVINNLQLIKYNMSKVVDVNINVSVQIDTICTLKSRAKMVTD